MNFQTIGYNGKNVGTISFQSDKLAWKDNRGHSMEISSSSIKEISWIIVGNKADLNLSANGVHHKFDGFSKSDFENIRSFAKDKWILELRIQEVGTSGANYGEMTLEEKCIVMKEPNNSKNSMELNINNITSCVVPANNKDDVEIQFQEDEADREDYSMVQITFHFPSGEGADHAPANDFKAQIVGLGVIPSVGGDIIAEFTKDQGNFVTPRGKYELQLSANTFFMKGAKYSYRIKYTDINSFFLLPEPGDMGSSFVIALEKPIRQGNQKYSFLVIYSRKEEDTIKINLTQEEIDQQYEGALSTEITNSRANLFAKIFKTLSKKQVFIPKNFKTHSNSHAIKCSYKANNGLLYPLTKVFIFIHKPTLIIKFEDVHVIEVRRYNGTGKTANRNFDIAIIIKISSSGYDAREFVFSSIDRIEYEVLMEYFRSRSLEIRMVQEVPDSSSKNLEHLDEEGDDALERGSNDSEEEDESYNGSESGSGDEGSEEEGSEDGSGEESGDEKRSGKRKGSEGNVEASKSKKPKSVGGN